MKNIILGIAALAVLALVVWFFVVRLSGVPAYLTYSIQDTSRTEPGVQGVTEHTYISSEELSALVAEQSGNGWYSWQGADVVWVPSFSQESLKIAYKIPEADLDSFVVFDSNLQTDLWAKDAQRVYFKYAAIAGADAASFAVMATTTVGIAEYGQDKNNIYFLNSRTGQISIVPIPQ